MSHQGASGVMNEDLLGDDRKFEYQSVLVNSVDLSNRQQRIISTTREIFYP